MELDLSLGFGRRHSGDPPLPELAYRRWPLEHGGDREATAVRGFDVNLPPATDEEEEDTTPPPPSPNHSVESSHPPDLGGGGERGSLRASDDEENGLAARKKLRLSKDQSALLEESFKEHNTLNPKQKVELAKELNLRPRQVEVWFQNRRARTKLKRTEVDCEYLKRCCESLTVENRSLQKELSELRALRAAAAAANPILSNLSATTLSLCPSCKRVASSGDGAGAGGVSPASRMLPRPRLFPFAPHQLQHHLHRPSPSPAT